jgi:hypothetical protein
MNWLNLLDLYRYFFPIRDRKPKIAVDLKKASKVKSKLMIGKTVYPSRCYSYNEVFNLKKTHHAE